MINLETYLLNEECRSWFVQGFICDGTDLEIFLAPTGRSKLNCDTQNASARSVKLFTVEEMEIWDFGKMQYDSISYIIAVPKEEKVLFCFSSTSGCHAIVFCAEVQEEVFENQGDWISDYKYKSKYFNKNEVKTYNQINSNWHDYEIVGFLRRNNEVEMLLVYPLMEEAVEGRFPLAGRIRLGDVLSQRVSNFQVQNILSYIKVKKQNNRLVIDLDCSIGCNALINCGKIEETVFPFKGQWEIKLR